MAVSTFISKRLSDVMSLEREYIRTMLEVAEINRDVWIARARDYKDKKELYQQR